MKAVLVMDMPENGCADCSICRESFLKTICGITGYSVSGNRERGGFPKECPLKPMPDKWIDPVFIKPHVDDMRDKLRDLEFERDFYKMHFEDLYRRKVEG